MAHAKSLTRTKIGLQQSAASLRLLTSWPFKVEVNMQLFTV